MNLIKNDRYRASLRKVRAAGLEGKRLLITGATGMIGSCIVDALMQWNIDQPNSCQVFAVGRSRRHGEHRFEAYWNRPEFSFLEQNILQELRGFPVHVDYLIHAASNADPLSFARDPVGVLMANVSGTNRLLKYGLSCGMTRFLYVSSGEMYGQPDRNMDDFEESYCGPVDHASARACYPVGKRAGEVLCQSYISQYQADAVIVRPCHVFGPTMTQRDSRAVSEFLRNAGSGKDIVMKSAGLLERSHCYVVDAVQGIFCALTEGACGSAYNIADKTYQMTIRDFALQSAAAGGSRVIFENPSDLESSGYSDVKRSVLKADRLEALGWNPDCAEGSAIRETVSILRELETECGKAN